MEDSRLTWLRVARLCGVGSVLIKRLVEALGSPGAILTAHPSSLASVDGIGTVKANQIVSSARETEAAAKEELARVEQHGITLIPFDDPRYPPALKTIPDPPPVLYLRGTLERSDALAIGIVGARKCTLYGREQSQRLAAQLAERGLTIISGGARGIDTSAHLGALQAGGRTIVVTGCGMLNTYPPENEALYERIVKEGRGAILSELPMEAPPSAENFPPRNRIIAGMSLGIVVVEANLQSGSLITARLAAGDYGREVFAMPGRVDSPASAGTHQLIKSATAHLVESADDVLAHLGDVGRALDKAQTSAVNHREHIQGLLEDARGAPVPAVPPPPPVPLTSVQQRIVAALTPKGLSVDDLVESTSLPAQVVMAELTMLQLRRHAKRLSDNRFASA